MGKRREGGFGERGQSCSLLLDVYYTDDDDDDYYYYEYFYCCVYIYIYIYIDRHIRGDPGFREGSRAWT